MTQFEKFLEGIKETKEEKFPFLFTVERGIITDELYHSLKIEGYSDNEIKFRIVSVPGNELKKVAHADTVSIEDILEKIFHYGQNDFQPIKGSPSVSVGDIIYFLERKFKVESVGFTEIK